MKTIPAAIAVILIAAVAQAAPQAGTPVTDQSLIELARRTRAAHKAQSAKPVKIFTNDNVPHHGGISVIGRMHAESRSRFESSGGTAEERDIPCMETALEQQTPEKFYRMRAPLERVRDTREERSTAAKDAFKRECPCPATGKARGACPGYVIDHIRPLACGGADAPANMAWQTTADAKAKDKWERKGCE